MQDHTSNCAADQGVIFSGVYVPGQAPIPSVANVDGFLSLGAWCRELRLTSRGLVPRPVPRALSGADCATSPKPKAPLPRDLQSIGLIGRLLNRGTQARILRFHGGAMPDLSCITKSRRA